MRKLLLLLMIINLNSCSSKKYFTISFKDEFIIADSLQFQNQTIGGLSGIDKVNNDYFFVIDDSSNPRVVIGKINIFEDSIQSVNFEKVIFLSDSKSLFFKENTLDLESIFVDKKTDEIHLVSEGNIRKNKLPTIFKISKNGSFLTNYQLPESLSNIANFKHNAAFESSAKSFDNKGFWVGIESPLLDDGIDPTTIKTNSPIRITYFDFKTKKPTKQFAYQLEKIPKPIKGTSNINGVTALMEIEKNRFLVVERAYQSNYGSYGNTIRIFEAFIDKNTTNILSINSLKNNNFTPLKKKLLFDFDTIKEFLTDGIIDNIEGITIGPKLKNGNQSLILIADDNFQSFGKQLNQLILLELKKK